MSCTTCAYPHALCQAAYCKRTFALPDPPPAPAYVAGEPLTQVLAPAWPDCPLACSAIPSLPSLPTPCA